MLVFASALLLSLNEDGDDDDQWRGFLVIVTPDVWVRRGPSGSGCYRLSLRCVH